MDLGLKGRTVIVTGGSSNIGRLPYNPLIQMPAEMNKFTNGAACIVVWL